MATSRFRVGTETKSTPVTTDVGVVIAAPRSWLTWDMRQSSQPIAPEKVSAQIEGWLKTDGDKTLGSLVGVFGEKSFAILFVLLLGVPALPLPTGGVTHVFEIIAVLVALQLIAGRDQIWLPQRWCGLELAGPRRERFLTGLMKLIRRLERFSKPRF